jgi:excinuclease UvrABC helicase subunit UvrB
VCLSEGFSINEQIEQLPVGRKSLLERQDSIILATVSAIYGIATGELPG